MDKRHYREQSWVTFLALEGPAEKPKGAKFTFIVMYKAELKYKQKILALRRTNKTTEHNSSS